MTLKILGVGQFHWFAPEAPDHLGADTMLARNQFLVYFHAVEFDGNCS